MRFARLHALPVLALLTFLMAAAAPLRPVLAAADSPPAVVETFQSGLLDVMKVAKTLSVKERYHRLLPVIEDGFHLRTMVRIAAGTYWEEASEDQRRDLTAAFKRMSVTTLATLFSGYSGQVFKTVGQTDGAGATVLVETHLTDPDGDYHSLAYVTKNDGQRWWIVDVIVDGGITI